MKSLIQTLILGIALFVLASAAVVKADTEVPCGEPKCVKTVYVGPSSSTEFDPTCTQQGYKVENMVCHKAKGIACTKAIYVHKTWSCQCSNADAKTRSTTIDIWCSQ